MAHYAFIDNNNVVTEVIVGKNENEFAEGVSSWEDYYGNLRGQRCLQTSYNTLAGVHTNGGTPLRGNYAAIGFTYDEERDAFISPKPYESWVLNEDTCLWEAPIPMPQTGHHMWDTEISNWTEVTE